MYELPIIRSEIVEIIADRHIIGTICNGIWTTRCIPEGSSYRVVRDEIAIDIELILREIGDLGSRIVVEIHGIFSRVDGSLSNEGAVYIFDTIFDENIAPSSSTIADCYDRFW